MTLVDRRTFLGFALGGVAAATPGLSFAQPPALSPARSPARSPGFRAAPLTDRLIMVTGAGANVLVGIEPDGLTIIDGGLEQNARPLLDFIRHETGAGAVKLLVNSHWHPQQTGLNTVLGADGTSILAHENTRLWLSSDIDAADNSLIHAALPAQARPTETFFADRAIAFGGGEARFQYVLQAHTDGDILSHFPEDNVIAAGGVLRTDGWPEIDWWTGGWLGTGQSRRLSAVLSPSYGGMLGGLQAILALADDDTQIVPADGPAVRRAEVQAQFDIYAALADSLREAMYSALGPDEAVALGLLDGVRPEWGDPDEFLVQAFKSLWPHFTPDA